MNVYLPAGLAFIAWGIAHLLTAMEYKPTVRSAILFIVGLLFGLILIFGDRYGILHGAG